MGSGNFKETAKKCHLLVAGVAGMADWKNRVGVVVQSV
jgi:hypothetical protein